MRREVRMEAAAGIVEIGNKEEVKKAKEIFEKLRRGDK